MHLAIQIAFGISLLLAFIGITSGAAENIFALGAVSVFLFVCFFVLWSLGFIIYNGDSLAAGWQWYLSH